MSTTVTSVSGINSVTVDTLAGQVALFRGDTNASLGAYDPATLLAAVASAAGRVPTVRVMPNGRIEAEGHGGWVEVNVTWSGAAARREGLAWFALAEYLDSRDAEDAKVDALVDKVAKRLAAVPGAPAVDWQQYRPVAKALVADGSIEVKL